MLETIEETNDFYESFLDELVANNPVRLHVDTLLARELSEW